MILEVGDASGERLAQWAKQCGRSRWARRPRQRVLRRLGEGGAAVHRDGLPYRRFPDGHDVAQSALARVVAGVGCHQHHQEQENEHGSDHGANLVRRRLGQIKGESSDKVGRQSR